MYNSKTSETEHTWVASLQFKIKRNISVPLLFLIFPPSFPTRVTTLLASYLCFCTSYEWKWQSVLLVSDCFGFSLLDWVIWLHAVADCSFLWPYNISLWVFRNLSILLLKTYMQLPDYSIMKGASINLLIYDFWWIYVSISIEYIPGIGIPGF